MNGSSKRVQPSGDEETERPERPVKRNRQVLSCLPCRDRKVACDRQHPCTGCVRYREPQRCVYLTDQAVEVSSHTPHHASVRSESAVSTPLTTTRATTNPFATGRLQSKPNKTIYYVGPTAWSVPAPYNVFQESNMIMPRVAQHWKSLLSLSAHFPPKPYDTIVDAEPQAADFSPSLESFLPSAAECNASVAAYLAVVNKVYPIVDAAAFKTTLRTTLLNPQSVSAPTLGLVLAIVAAGSAIRAFSEQQRSALLQQCDNLAVIVHTRALTFAVATYRPTLPVFQTILALVVIKILRFTWRDGNNGISGLLGMASRLSFTMGLHRAAKYALSPMSADEMSMRRRVYATYVLLDYYHSLQCGMPFLLRPSDFDTDYSSDHSHLGVFMRLFPKLAQALQLTHSSNSNTSEAETVELLSSLKTLAEEFPHPPPPEPGLSVAIQTILPSLLLDRARIGLYFSVLDSPKLRRTYSLNKDLLDPALNILETFASLRAVHGDNILLIGLFRHTILASTGFLLAFLHCSLSDDTLLAARGSFPAAQDSTRIFRLIRETLLTIRAAMPFSLQCIREYCSHQMHLRYVQERHRRFIAQGIAHFDPESQDGQEVMQGMGDTIEEGLRVAESILGPLPSPATAELPMIQLPLSYDEVTEPMAGWEWPWVGEAGMEWMNDVFTTA